METGFSQDTLDSQTISQTIEELTCLQQTVIPSSSQLSSAEQTLLGIPSGNNRPGVSSQGQGQSHTDSYTQAHTSVNYQQNRSNVTEIHMPDGQVLTPHYVIVEDPVALHSYADFTATAVMPNFAMSGDKNESVLVVTNSEVSSNNYTINTTSGGGTNDLSVSNISIKPKVTITDARNLRKETILAIPVIGVKKSASAQQPSRKEKGSAENRTPATFIELQEQLKEHLIRKEAENSELQKIKLGLSKEVENVPKNMEDTETDTTESTELSSMFTKDSIQSNKMLQQENSATNCAEAGTNTEDHLLAPDFDASDTEQAKNEENSYDKITQEKTMFSENLGLIPAENEMKIIAERARNASRGVRTRKSYEQGALTATVEPVSFTGSVLDAPVNSKPTGFDFNETFLNQGHKHRPGCYRCGACSRTFVTICKLHDHLQDHCFGGSYHYDHLLKTAFPKYDTTCSYAQTNFDFYKEPPQKLVKPTKKGRVAIKLKAPKLKTKSASFKSLTSTFGKRKRGRPRKIEVVNENDKQHEEMDLEVEYAEPSEDFPVELKEEPVGYNIDGTEFDTACEPESNTEETYDNTEENADGNEKNTSELVDHFLKDLEDDIGNIARSEPEKEKKKMRKRKSSIPRKIMVTSESDSDKIVNSRSKPEMKITCEFCPSKFQYTRGLIRHEQEKHADQMKFECDQCDQKFMREYNLERHKLCSHTVGKSKFIQQRKGIYREKKRPGRRPQDKSPEPNTTCEICGMDVPESKLDIHIRLHTGMC